MNRIAAYLNRYIDGVAYSAPSILEKYATDRSILKYHPRIVAIPANTQDLCRLLRFSFQLTKKNISLPVTVQGAANSKTGSAIGNGLLVSTEKLNRILEIDVRQRLARVQCGASYHDVREALRSHGLDLPIQADPSETIGGIIARGARGSLNAKPLDISDMIEQLEFVLYDGTIIESQKLNPTKGFNSRKLKATEKEIYRKLAPLIKAKKGIEQNTDHRGLYNLAKASEKSFNLADLVCGSEGTLGIISEVILRCEAIYDEPNYVAVLCPNNSKFIEVAGLMHELKFSDVVFYDTEIFNAKESTGKDTSFFRSASDDGFLVVAQAKDDSKRLRRKKVHKLAKKLPTGLKLIESDDKNIAEFVTLNEKLSAYLNDTSNTQHLPLFDDVYVPSEKMKEYLEGVNKFAKALNMPLALYGNLDHQLFTMRPAFNLNESNDRRKLIKMFRIYIDFLDQLGASPCGNASSGRLMAMFSNVKRDAKQLALEAEIKKIFDPAEILNPGLKHEADAKVILKHFRTSYNKGVSSKD